MYVHVNNEKHLMLHKPYSIQSNNILLGFFFVLDITWNLPSLGEISLDVLYWTISNLNKEYVDGSFK